jgi:hypothetical protein
MSERPHAPEPLAAEQVERLRALRARLEELRGRL